VFHSPNLILQKSRTAPAHLSGVGHAETKLYEAIDGRRTLAEITMACRTSEHAAGGVLLRYVEQGLIQLRDVQVAKTDIVDDATAVAKLRELVASEEFEEAIGWIDRCRLKSDGDEFLAMLIAKAETGFLAEAYRTQVPADAVPRRVRQDEPPGREAEMLSREDVLLLDLVDGHWDVRSLSWIAPIRKVDIIRGLLRLRRQGLIELQTPLGAASPHDSEGPSRKAPSGGDASTDIDRAVSELGV
jgi:hypothetical protein